MTEPVASAPMPSWWRRRGLWVALGVSLAVNLFFAGWVASSWLYGAPLGPGARATQASGMAFHHRRALHAVSGEHRAAAERIWRENFPQLRERVRELRQAQIGLRNAFTADQADAQALDAARKAVKVKADAVFDQLNETLLRIAAALPPDARKAYFNTGLTSPRARERERRRERGAQ
jgi:uncharacterized membrane protein